jgi:hypothetical protein
MQELGGQGGLGSVKMGRRDLILAMSGAALSFTAGRIGFGHPETETLRAILLDASSAKAVGEAYLRENPGERERIVGSLESVLGVNPADVESRSVRRLRDKLVELIRTDFANLRIVRVKGWMLSRTEARLCVLMTEFA